MPDAYVIALFQGTASVVLAGLVASLNLVGGTLSDHRFLFLGAGEVSHFIVRQKILILFSSYKY